VVNLFSDTLLAKTLLNLTFENIGEGRSGRSKCHEYVLPEKYTR